MTIPWLSHTIQAQDHSPHAEPISETEIYNHFSVVFSQKGSAVIDESVFPDHNYILSDPGISENLELRENYSTGEIVVAESQVTDYEYESIGERLNEESDFLSQETKQVLLHVHTGVLFYMLFTIMICLGYINELK